MLLWTTMLAALAAGPRPSQGVVTVDVTEDPSNDRWSVTYTVPKKVRGLVFLRDRQPVQKDWNVKGGTIEGQQPLLVALPNKKTSDVFRVSFDTDDRRLTKEYGLNLRFGDGGRLLYTGHLAVGTLVCPDKLGPKCTDDQLELVEYPLEYQFHTQQDRYIVAPSGRKQGHISWAPEEGHLYIYFGDIEPLPQERMVVLVDPTMPQWIVDRTNDWTGKLLDYFSAETGQELSFKPILLLSYGPGSGSKRQHSFDGGGLPGQLQLNLQGQGWQTESSKATQVYAHFLAHETFHMYNGQQYQTWIDPSEEWLSEGSAELFALWATQENGIVNDKEAASWLREQAADCARTLEDKPLLTAHKEGSYRSFYSCGAVGLFLLGEKIRQRSDHGLAGAFQRMFSEDETYSTYELLEAAQAMTKDPLVAAELERLLRLGLGDNPLERLAEQLNDAGVSSLIKDLWTIDNVSANQLRRGLLSTIADCDCSGASSVWNKGSYLDFEPVDTCKELNMGMKVTKAAGVSVESPGSALAAVWLSIEESEQFELSGPDGRLTIQCSASALPRPSGLIAGPNTEP